MSNLWAPGQINVNLEFFCDSPVTLQFWNHTLWVVEFKAPPESAAKADWSKVTLIYSVCTWTEMAACIATWSFGLQAVQTASRLLEERGDCVDAIETAVSGQ